MFKLFKIQGHSMEPTFREGGYVLVRKGYPKIGDVVVFRSSDDRFLIKRVTDLQAGEYFVRSDNPHCALENYPVYPEDVIGRVWLF